MKTLLIGINAKYIHPALSIYQLKFNTEEKVDIYETTIKEPLNNILNTIKQYIENGYTHISFSTYLWNIEIILEIITHIRNEYENIIISSGGPETGYDPTHFLNLYNKFYYFDYIFIGEGEESFDQFCKFLNNKLKLSDVSNIYYRDSLNPNSINFTYRSYPNLNKIKQAIFEVPNYKNRVVYLESSRGCPFHCSYCTASLENKVRFFPHQEVLNILKRLMNEEVKVVKFLDRTFNANVQYMIDILNLIKKYNKNTIFQFEVVGDMIKDEVIELIRTMDDNYLRLEIGIQTFNEKSNSAINRKQNISKLQTNILKLLETNKVDIHVDLIAGLPYEDLKSFINSFNLTFNLNPQELQLGFLKFLRGTHLLTMIDEHNYIYDTKAPYEIISNKYLSNNDLKLIHQVEDALDKYYNKGKFKKTFKYLISNNLILNPFDFFNSLYIYSSSIKSLKRQLSDIFIDFDNFIKANYPEYIYENIKFLIIQDYLESVKVRPKIWWDNNISKIERKHMYEDIIKKCPSLTLDILYRYSVVYKQNNIYYVIIYQNHSPKSYLL